MATSKSDLHCRVHFENNLDPKIPLHPPFPKGEIESLPFIKGDLEGFF
jgi:hypothetical protein